MKCLPERFLTQSGRKEIVLTEGLGKWGDVLGPPALQREGSAEEHVTSLLHLGAHGSLTAQLRNGLLFSGLMEKQMTFFYGIT